MKQDVFQQRHEAEWRALDEWLKQRQRPRPRDRAHDAEGVFGDLEFPAAYRRVCQHLALARRRGYSVVLIERLQELVHRGHLVLYRPRSPRWQAVANFFGAEFPRLVRQQWRAMALAAALLFLPLIGLIVLLQYRPELVHSIYGPAQLAEYEAMYNPATVGEKLGRESGSDMKMFGFYIMNNISIGFRTFAAGLLGGVGSMFVLVMNGVMIGAVAGHLTAIGYGGPFWRFVVGHSAPELLAIVISGGAGLQLGFALIAPGRRSRGRALVEAGVIGARLIFGVFALLLFAAFVEAFWSSIGWMPDAVKFSVGGLLWLGILLWLWRGGRGVAHAA
ncbi:stage II sporulation protein M [Tahibacter harae]|uniref:Stage II sporulation protein M n=1 Tax=Tahibacter harae TaxID=2963937 RepID=A0ABT1QTX0_9GAMM|nr:stage II sporulation protein M [Tahibacter harae]MCQ4165724.1 stage II sporulation protein M [Tahibacter harae]